MQTNDMIAYRLVSKSKWTLIIQYRVETWTNSCWMHIMRVKHVSRVWCGNIYTFRLNTYRVTIHFECFVQTNDMIAYRLKTKFDHTVSCWNELVRDTHQTGQIRIECLVQKHKYISLKYTSSVSCKQIAWYHIFSYTRAGCISCRTNKRQVFSAET